MESTELIKNMGIYNKAQQLETEIAKKKRDLEIAEATLKTQERSRESFINIGGSMKEDRDGIRGSGRTIERLKSEIENLGQELKIEEEKLQEKNPADSGMKKKNLQRFEIVIGDK
jgi:hypothetical protein